jgi:hypothetical protein
MMMIWSFNHITTLVYVFASYTFAPLVRGAHSRSHMVRSAYWCFCASSKKDDRSVSLCFLRALDASSTSTRRLRRLASRLRARARVESRRRTTKPMSLAYSRKH